MTNDSAPSGVRRPARLRVVDPVAAPRARLRLHRGAAVYPPIVAAVYPPVRQFTRQSVSGPMDTAARAAADRARAAAADLSETSLQFRTVQQGFELR